MEMLLRTAASRSVGRWQNAWPGELMDRTCCSHNSCWCAVCNWGSDACKGVVGRQSCASESFYFCWFVLPTYFCFSISVSRCSSVCFNKRIKVDSRSHSEFLGWHLKEGAKERRQPPALEALNCSVLLLLGLQREGKSTLSRVISSTAHFQFISIWRMWA